MQLAGAASVSSMNTDSVISSSSRSAGRPVVPAPIAQAIQIRDPASCTGETFTATRTPLSWFCPHSRVGSLSINYPCSHWDELAQGSICPTAGFKPWAGAGDFPGGEIHLGLPMQAGFVAADSLAQTFFHLCPPAGTFSAMRGCIRLRARPKGLASSPATMSYQQFVHMGDFTVYQRNATTCWRPLAIAAL